MKVTTRYKARNAHLYARRTMANTKSVLEHPTQKFIMTRDIHALASASYTDSEVICGLTSLNSDLTEAGAWHLQPE